MTSYFLFNSINITFAMYLIPTSFIDIIHCLSFFPSSVPECEHMIKSNKLNFVTATLEDMSSVCKQSSFDAIIDYGGLDELLLKNNGDITKALACIDQLQNAVRLGNILVCLSKLEKEQFCAPFEERFGWVQELDGDPGEISAWYRGKTNIEKSTSNFLELGLKMYVYTNVDNC